ncbi:MAG: MerR family transcriptional regulator [Myxococcota bacterium]|nr:MerR family transcriptional regulator [Myxococcota bacterium]
MEYRVEELAGAVGIRVDTLRFYQARGLLSPPGKRGRVAIYGDEHLRRLQRIRELQRDGFTLAQIRRLLDGESAEQDSGLLAALVRERVGERTLTRAELAAEAGVPEVLVRAAETAGLVEPLVIDGEERFGESEVEMARVGLALLEAGFPMQTLLQHAVGHAQHVQQLCDVAIDLFDTYVRHEEGAPGEAVDDPTVTAVFQDLMPQITRLVALHFQRTLVNRALNRLRGSEEHDALRAALEATENAHLEVEVKWR